MGDEKNKEWESEQYGNDYRTRGDSFIHPRKNLIIVLLRVQEEAPRKGLYGMDVMHPSIAQYSAFGWRNEV